MIICPVEKSSQSCGICEGRSVEYQLSVEDLPLAAWNCPVAFVRYAAIKVAGSHGGLSHDRNSQNRSTPYSTAVDGRSVWTWSPAHPLLGLPGPQKLWRLELNWNLRMMAVPRYVAKLKDHEIFESSRWTSRTVDFSSISKSCSSFSNMFSSIPLSEFNQLFQEILHVDWPRQDLYDQAGPKVDAIIFGKRVAPFIHGKLCYPLVCWDMRPL